MQITECEPNNQNYIQSFKAGEIRIANKCYQNSLLITTNTLESLQPSTIDQISQATINQLLTIKPEVLLIGTGLEQRFPATPLFASLIDAQIGMEIMNTQSACRTFNILLAESRYVAAILINEAP